MICLPNQNGRGFYMIGRIQANADTGQVWIGGNPLATAIVNNQSPAQEPGKMVSVAGRITFEPGEAEEFQ